jgi:hypothetical protein
MRERTLSVMRNYSNMLPAKKRGLLVERKSVTGGLLMSKRIIETPGILGISA